MSIGVVALWGAVWLAGADRADPGAAGPYAVGVVTVEIVDAGRDERRLVTEIWYPAEPGPDAAGRYPSGIPTRAWRGVPAAPGPFPWLVFSHGLAAMREQSAFLTEHLASHGYIVAAPDHPNTMAGDLRLLELHQASLERPTDLHAVIDGVLRLAHQPGSPLYGRVRPAQLGVIGHSLGGLAALAAAGAWVEARRLPAAANGGRKVDFYDYRDPRIGAVVALAPLSAPAFGPQGLARLRVPALVLGGTQDQVTPFESNQLPIFEHAAGPCVLARVEGASHFSFNDEEMLTGALFVIRRLHRPTAARPATDAIIRRLVLAFLDRYLVGNAGLTDWLSSQPGVEVRTRQNCRR